MWINDTSYLKGTKVPILTPNCIYLFWYVHFSKNAPIWKFLQIVFHLFFLFFRYRPKASVKHHSSRSLDRLQHEDDLEANKENAFKTRIQVISPDRQHMIQNGYNRKPYKTTINTATDNILYRGNSSDNLSYYHFGDGHDGHYKVPRGKPVMVRRENGSSPYR